MLRVQNSVRNLPDVMPRTLRELFCQRFGCPEDSFETRAFARCLYAHARIIAPILRLVSRDFFAEDFKFLRALGDSSDPQEARVELLDFQIANFTGRTPMRTGLRLRVSGRKAQALASELFGQKEKL